MWSRCASHCWMIITLILGFVIPIGYLKGERSYFLKFSFLFHLKNHHFKVINLKFELKWSSRLDIKNNFCDLQLPNSYCISIIGYHNKTSLHQFLSNGTYFSRKIWHGLWEKYDLSSDTKISLKFEKSWKKYEVV